MMDKELLRQREAFKKRALAQPTVEKRKLKTKDDSDEQAAKKQKSSSKQKGILKVVNLHWDVRIVNIWTPEVN